MDKIVILNPKFNHVEMAKPQMNGRKKQILIPKMF